MAVTESQRCTATKKNGDPCGSLARPGMDTCHFHTPGVDPAEVGRKAGIVSGANRSVRERFREDAERCYEKLIESLFEAIEAETVKWGDCPNCKHKTPVSFPDVRARTQAIQILLDQGYGKPKETVQVGDDGEELREKIAALSPEERLELNRRLLARNLAKSDHGELVGLQEMIDDRRRQLEAERRPVARAALPPADG